MEFKKVANFKLLNPDPDFVPALKTFLKILLALVTVSVPDLQAQELKFTHYSVDNGLPSSQVHDIIQDKRGYLWFTTDGGLSRYDGYSFKNYTTPDGLTDNSLFKFFPQENGDIWLTTLNKSTFCISGSGPTFKPYKFNKLLRNLPDNFVACALYVSKDSCLWMSFNSGGAGYVKIDAKGNIFHKLHNFWDYNVQLALFPDKPNFFQYTTRKGASKSWDAWPNAILSSTKKNLFSAKPYYMKKKRCAIFSSISEIQIQRTKDGDTIQIPTLFEPISLGELNDSLFWVGFRYGGISIFDLSGKRLSTFLPGKSVTALYIDKQNGYWFSTLEDGVFHSSNTSILYHQNPEKSNNWISSLAQDATGNLWIGYYNGDVSFIASKKTINKHFSLQKRPAIVTYHRPAKSIFFSSDYGFFNSTGKRIGTQRDLGVINFCINPNDSILVASYNFIHVIHEGKDTSVKTGFRTNTICVHKNCIYLGTNKGLYTMQGSKVSPLGDALISSSKISDIDSWNEKLILATKGSGVILKTNKITINLDTKDGLSSNIVNEVCVENDSTFWACTNNGLNRIVFKDGIKARVDVISAREGLMNKEVTDIEIINDTVWVGTRQGLCSFPLAMLNQKAKYTNYYLTINLIKANDSILNEQKADDLNYKQNRIEFGFKAISFSESSTLLYRYKLVGHEKKWNYTSSLSSIYTSLPPGKYTFVVQVKGTNTLWELSQQQFSFTIHPPFWKTWWFVSLAIIVLGVLVYLFFRYKIVSYNRDITRELLRQLVKRLTRRTHYVVFREQGKHIRIPTTAIYFVKADGNYIEIHTYIKKYVIRYKIGEFLGMVPDPLEYVRINRSYIVRLDKIEEKGKKDITVKGEKISVGETYLDQLKNIQF